MLRFGGTVLIKGCLLPRFVPRALCSHSLDSWRTSALFNERLSSYAGTKFDEFARQVAEEAKNLDKKAKARIDAKMPLIKEELALKAEKINVDVKQMVIAAEESASKQFEQLKVKLDDKAKKDFLLAQQRINLGVQLSKAKSKEILHVEQQKLKEAISKEHDAINAHELKLKLKQESKREKEIIDAQIDKVKTELGEKMIPPRQYITAFEQFVNEKVGDSRMLTLKALDDLQLQWKALDQKTKQHYANVAMKHSEHMADLRDEWRLKMEEVHRDDLLIELLVTHPHLLYDYELLLFEDDHQVADLFTKAYINNRSMTP